MGAQRYYVATFVVSLGLMILGATASLITGNFLWGKDYAPLAPVLLGCALLLSALMQVQRKDRLWYMARALAESVKTTAWKYMSGAEPFGLTLTPHDADKAFTNRLTELAQEYRETIKEVTPSVTSSDQITDQMRSVRSSDLPARQSVYLRHRIQEQRDWYSGKANFNQRRQLVFFGPSSWFN